MMKKSNVKQSKKKKPLRPQQAPSKSPAIVLDNRKIQKQFNCEEARLITSGQEAKEIYFGLQDEIYLWLDKYQDAIDLLKRTRENAVTGRKLKDAARKGGEAKEGSADDRHKEWQEEADRIAKERSQKLRPLTKIELARLIARKTGGKVDTIRRVIKKPT